MGSETRPLSTCKRTRLDLELRLVDVAERAGVSVGYLSMCESGYIPKAAVRERIAKALGCEAAGIWPELYA